MVFVNGKIYQSNMDDDLGPISGNPQMVILGGVLFAVGFAHVAGNLARNLEQPNLMTFCGR